MQGRVRWGQVGLVGLMYLGSASEAQAQIFPLGGRTAQMGGAATASGRDSAMPYLNPAGLAGLPRDLFALSANIYGISQFRIKPFFIKEFQFTTVVDEDVQRGQSIYQLPSSIMYLVRVSDPEAPVRHKIGVSLIIPNATKVTVGGSYRARQPTVFGAASDSRFFSFEFTDYNLGATYALAVGERFRFGATLFGRYTDSQTTNQQTRSQYSFSGAVQSGTTISESTQSTTRSAWGKLGVQAGLSDRFWLGLGVSTPTFLSGGVDRGLYVTDDQANGVVTHLDTTSEGTIEERLPWSFNAGLSYEQKGSWGFAVDVTHTRGLDGGTRWHGVSHTLSTKTNEITRDLFRPYENSARFKPATNLALGVEFWVASWAAVRLGGFTSFNTLDDPDPAKDPPYTGNADTFGVTGGLGLLMGPTETSLGVSYQRSQGKITVSDQSLKPPTPSALGDYTVNTILFMLAGAVSIEEAKEQIKGTLPRGAVPSTPLPVELP